MDDTLKKPQRSIPKTSPFLFCFGFHGKNPTRPVQTDNEKKRRPWMSLSRFGTTKRSFMGCKRTVPVVEPVVSERKKMQDKKTYSTRKANLKCKSIDMPATPTPDPPISHQILPPTQEVVYSEEPQETRHGSKSNEKNILEHRKSLERVGSPTSDTNNKRQGFRRKDVIKPRSTQQDNQNSGRPSSVLRSVSFPNPIHKENPPAHDRVLVRKSQKDIDAMAKSSDPIVGMSVITVTLLVMLLCGRVCAVLCTCAWVYFVPHLRTRVDPRAYTRKAGSVSAEPDLDSEEYKKRVVLEGLLERNRRSPM